MYKLMMSLIMTNLLIQPVYAEDSIERWRAMQDRMAYEDRLDRQREKANYDQMELEGLRNNQNRIIKPSSCTTSPVTTSGGMTYMQTICQP
jgi:hypothetical protein